MVPECTTYCHPCFAPTIVWSTPAEPANCLQASFEVKDLGTKENMLYNKEELLNSWFLVNDYIVLNLKLLFDTST